MGQPQPLFDMSKAQPIQGAEEPLFDMSKAQPIAESWWHKTFAPRPAMSMPGARAPQKGDPLPGNAEGANLAEGLSDYDRASFGEAGGGVADIARGDIAKGMHRVISGAGAGAAPVVLPFAAVAAPGATAATLATGAIGQQIGKRGAQALGATEDQSDLAGDVAGIVAGYGGSKMPGGKIVRAAAKGTNAVLSKAPGTVGAVVGGTVGHATGIPYAGEVGAGLGSVVGKELLPKLKVPGEAFGLPKPVYPGAPLPESPGYNPGAPLPQHPGVFPGAPEPVTPPKELLQAQPLAQGGTAPPPSPSDALGKIPVQRVSIGGRSIADGVRQPAQAPSPSSAGLQNLLNDSLGGRPLQPNVPLKDQLPAMRFAQQPPSAPTAEPEHMGQFARANGLDLHQAIPETVAGDVLRAKIHNLTNVQVRQLAINAGEDMGQQAVTNAKNAGGVTRQDVLSRILAKHTPEEIGQMIDQGQHLPPDAGNLTPRSEVPLFNLGTNGIQRGSIATALAGKNGR